MSDFNDEKYRARKAFYAAELIRLHSLVDKDSKEDTDAFFNAVEDFYEDGPQD